ncbi:squalene synthase HpnC [Candidimonas nitroreducens]|uniref:Squalene synthase HpnC n=1 Tax=Candidimonas nitroreducens TaxID=683354 RepID=A0A225M6D1_9BURK|nr:squalene synthase HpnC [Candidimonas nitroreducens]OWT56252.1 squalene synthase HpnC [Candidimonas nitroreducens]
MAVDHYENFPVASLLLPARLRGPVRDIYRYARSADDIADEGSDDDASRLRRLAAYRRALQDIGTGTLALAGGDPLAEVFVPLARSIKQHQLPLQCFFDLLSAFEQDVRLHRYESDAQLLDYCSRSANPVGRLMLHLYQAVSPENLRAADSLCTGLQLVNFWQDVAVDWAKGRVYLPREKLRRHGVDEAQIARGDTGPAWQQLMRAQAAQAREMLQAGLPLARRLPGRIGLELRMVAHGGLRILERLERIHYDVFHHRPTLRKSDWALLLWRALR